MIPKMDDFDCEYCGEKFGSDPKKLSIHIARTHVERKIEKS